MKENEEIKELLNQHKWKKDNENYIKELQKMLDLIDNVENKKLKREIINQTIRFDQTITKLAEEIFKKLQSSK